MGKELARIFTACDFGLSVIIVGDEYQGGVNLLFCGINHQLQLIVSGHGQGDRDLRYALDRGNVLHDLCCAGPGGFTGALDQHLRRVDGPAIEELCISALALSECGVRIRVRPADVVPIIHMEFQRQDGRDN